MAWDDNKGPGDGLPSSEWNSHVTHQKNRSTISTTEPTVGTKEDGDSWYQPTKIGTSGSTFDTGGSEIIDIVYDSNNNQIYVIYGNILAAYDTSGNQQWTYTVGTATANTCVYDSTDDFVIVTQGADSSSPPIRAVSASTGAEQWTNSDAIYGAGLSYDNVNNQVIYGENAGGATNPETVYAVDASTGSTNWSHTLHGGSISSSTYGDVNDLVFSEDGSTIEAVDATTGNSSYSVSSNDSYLKYNLNEGVLYSTDSNTIRKRNPSDGSVTASFTAPSTINNKPTYNSTSNSVYLPVGLDTVIALKQDFTSLWSYTELSFESKALTFRNSNDTVYVGDNAGSVLELIETDAVDEFTLYNGNWVPTL